MASVSAGFAQQIMPQLTSAFIERQFGLLEDRKLDRCQVRTYISGVGLRLVATFLRKQYPTTVIGPDTSAGNPKSVGIATGIT